MSEYKMRPYQEECQKVIKEAGPGRHLIALATGLGKTVIFTHLDGMGRTLIMSHRDELVRQPGKYYDGRKTFGVEKADEHATDEEVVSASVQTLAQDNRLNSYAKDAFETIIVDEAHHAAAPTYRKILDYFSGANRVLGFTATPKRGDGVRLDDVFEDIIYSRDIRYGIKNGYLSRLRCEEVKVTMDLNNVKKTAGDYNAGQMETEMLDNSPQLIPEAAAAYKKICHEGGRHTLIYCVTKRVCLQLEATIKKLLPEKERETIAVLFGDTPDEERKAILAGFMEGSIRCIINCMVLTEGTDLPICDAVMNMRLTCNDSLYQQIVGRGTRLYEGKEFCLIVDIVPSTGLKKNRELCTAPTLFGIDPTALNKEQAKEFTKDADLMDLCDKIDGRFAEKASKLEIKSRQVEMLLSDYDVLFMQAKGKDINTLLNLYTKNREEQSGELPKEFDGLDVSCFASDSARYLIRPNWEKEIWISEPNVLNKVRIQIKDIESELPILSKEMSFKAAANLAREYCEVQPPFYKHSWSKEAQELWKNEPASDAQKGKIRALAKKREISGTGTNALSKLTASQLIDLMMRYEKTEEKAKLFELANSGSMSKEVLDAKKKLEEILQKEEKNRKSMQTGIEEDIHRAYLRKTTEEKMKKRYSGTARFSKSDAPKNTLREIAEKGYIEVPGTQIKKGYHMTEKQKAFMMSLAKETGVFNDERLRYFSSRQACVMINLLKTVHEIEGRKKQYYFTVLPEAWKIIISAENSYDQTFKIPIRMNVQFLEQL